MTHAGAPSEMEAADLMDFHARKGNPTTPIRMEFPRKGR